MDGSDRQGLEAFGTGWPIPSSLRLVRDPLGKDWLTWDPVAPVRIETPAIGPSTEVLTEFVRLATLDASILPDAVLTFARRWGVLSVCSQHPGHRHPIPTVFGGPYARASMAPPEAAWESLDWWADLAGQYRALFSLADDLRRRGMAGSDEDWTRALPQVPRTILDPYVGLTMREVLGPEASAGIDPAILDGPAGPDVIRTVTAPIAGLPQGTPAGRRMILAVHLSELLRSEHVAPALDSTDVRFVAGYAVGGLTGALTLAVYLAVLGGKVPCVVCGRPVSARVQPPMCDRDRRIERERARRSRLRDAMTPDQLAESRQAEAARKRAQRARDRQGGAR